MITSGIEGLLRTLHRKVRWDPPYLEIAGDTDQEIRLDGRGLLLSPSLFLRDTACFALGAENAQHALVFPAPVTGVVTTGLCEKERLHERALGALVGHTRAAALRVLTDSCTTGRAVRAARHLPGGRQQARHGPAPGRPRHDRTQPEHRAAQPDVAGLALLGLTEPATEPTTYPAARMTSRPTPVPRAVVPAQATAPCPI